MNQKGVYSGFIAVMAIGLVLFVGLATNATLSSDASEVYKEKFRQVPLIVENSRALMDDSIQSLGNNTYACASAGDMSYFTTSLPGSFYMVNGEISSTYGINCVTGVPNVTYNSSLGTISVTALMTCGTSTPFAFNFSKNFTFEKSAAITFDGTTSQCTAVIADLPT